MFESYGCYVDFGSTCSDTKKFYGHLYSTSEACSKGIISHFLKVITMFYEILLGHIQMALHIYRNSLYTR